MRAGLHQIDKKTRDSFAVRNYLLSSNIITKY